MSKSATTPTTTNPTGTSAKYDFYRPHDRSATWYTGEVEDPVTGEIFKPESRTKQSFLEQCDINTILKQYQRTGMLNHVNARASEGAYTDLPDEVDFQEALHTVQRAEDSFATLPSKLRARFNNDPGEFMAFMSDPQNAAEAVELGLATKISPPVEAPPPEAPPSPPDSKA